MRGKSARAPVSPGVITVDICYKSQLDLKLRYWQDNKGFDKPDFCRVLSINLQSTDIWFSVMISQVLVR